MAENVTGLNIDGLPFGMQDSGARTAARAAVTMVRSIAEKVEQSSENSANAIEKSKSVEEKINALSLRIDDTESLVDDVTDKTKKIDKTASEALGKVESAVLKVNSSANKIQQAIENNEILSQKIDNNKNEIQQLREISDNASSVLTTLCTKAEATERKINDFETLHENTNERISSIEHKFDIAEATFDQAKLAEEKSIIAEKLSSRAEKTSAEALLIVRNFEDDIDRCNNDIRKIQEKCTNTENLSKETSATVKEVSTSVKEALVKFEMMASKKELNAASQLLQSELKNNRQILEYKKQRWLTVDFQDVSKFSLRVASGTSIRLDVLTITETEMKEQIRRFDIYDSAAFPMLDDMQKSANASSERPGEINGRDFYVYLVPEGEIQCTLVCSLRKDCPSDIDSSFNSFNTKRVGMFSTLCVDCSETLKTKRLIPHVEGLVVGDSICLRDYYNQELETEFYNFYNKKIVTILSTGTCFDTVECQHPLAGFTAGMIIPESVQCLSWHRKLKTDIGGMVYVPEVNKACCIYPQNNILSIYKQEYNTEKTYKELERLFTAKGYTFPDITEFRFCAQGGNEGTNIKDSILPTDGVGGHLDTLDNRMISELGVEELTGILHCYLRNKIIQTSDTWIDTPFGSQKQTISYMIAGGSFDSNTKAGSEAVEIITAEDSVSNATGRCVCDWSTENWIEMYV